MSRQDFQLWKNLLDIFKYSGTYQIPCSETFLEKKNSILNSVNQIRHFLIPRNGASVVKITQGKH